MADDPLPPPNTSKVKKRKKAEQNNTSDDDTDAEFIARYTKIVTEMKKAKIMFPRSSSKSLLYVTFRHKRSFK